MVITYSTSSTWSYWTSQNTTSTASSTSVWTNWTQQPTTSTYTSTWTYWVSGTASSTSTYTSTSIWNYEQAARVQTKEEIAAYEARQAQYREEAAAREKARKEADATAETLLKDNLSDEEKARYERAGYFHVRGKRGTLYKIKKGSHGNVIRINAVTHEEEVSYCIQPDDVPLGDVNLAQKLWIEDNEEEFIQMAGKRQLRAA